MDLIKIKGGKPLKGRIHISGAKNACLPLMIACLLTEDTLVLSRVPYLEDIVTMINLLMNHGVKIDLTTDNSQNSGKTLLLTADNIDNLHASYESVRKMRASFLVLGPLLSKYRQAKVPLPGGCAIGARPINLHLSALEQMGANITLEEGNICASVNGRLKGAMINFDIVSVGATQNILMAATLADGTTVINNAAREPEVTDLANCLIAMGANISGIGSSCLTIEGVKELHGTSHPIIADRIEGGTYALAAAITGGDVILENIQASLMDYLLKKMIMNGIEVELLDSSIRIKRDLEKDIIPLDMVTEVYPGFATDLQAPYMALMCMANGTSIIKENIFENRFMQVAELNRLGANIKISGNTAIVQGVKHLSGAPVMATDLRAASALVIAGLAAEGETIINNIYHIDRGYEIIEEKLRACGADIIRIKGA
jgi:UDP-N-acetylglucosamine 1-carboxyvinyltransferase